MNLLEETREEIKNSGHETEDIIFIGSKQSGHSCSWSEFETLADIEYDDGVGGQEVAKDLIIAFKDGLTMWREERDGSEWWEYPEIFSMPKEKHKIISLVSVLGVVGQRYWCTLSEFNKQVSENDQ